MAKRLAKKKSVLAQPTPKRKKSAIIAPSARKRKATAIPQMPTPGERQRLGEIMDACIAFLDPKLDLKERSRQLKEKLTECLFLDGADANAFTSSVAFSTAVKGTISYLVEVAKKEEQKTIGMIADLMVEVLQERFGKAVKGHEPISFDTLSGVRQAYWSRRTQKSLDDFRGGQPTFKLVRINNIPFAESVFPKLLAQYTGALGYAIETVDIKWNEVGLALRSNRIDVALYNGSILGQLRDMDHLFERKLLYCSKTLFRYRKYPLIGVKKPGPKTADKLAVPGSTDFEEVIIQSARSNKIAIAGRRRKLDIRTDIIYCKSADDALAHVVNGEVRYGLVGGLQAHYGMEQFPDRIRLVKNLDRHDDDGDVRFWVAVDRKDEASKLIPAMVSVWNEHIAKGWTRITNGLGDDIDTLKEDLLASINSQSHKVFVKSFDHLKQLIKYHDGERFDSIDRDIENVF